MPDPDRDDPPLGIPSEGPLRAEDLQTVRIPSAMRGYRMDVVDALLDRAHTQWVALEARLNELEGGDDAEGTTFAADGHVPTLDPTDPDLERSSVDENSASV